jgi:hypothetical protein
MPGCYHFTPRERQAPTDLQDPLFSSAPRHRARGRGRRGPAGNRRGDAAARRRVHQADPDAHRADHLHHDHRGHRADGPDEGRQPHRPARAALLRGRVHAGARHRPGRRQCPAAGVRPARDRQRGGHQGRRELRGSRRAQPRRCGLSAQHHPDDRGGRVRPRRHPPGAVRLDAHRHRAAVARRTRAAAGRHHRPAVEDALHGGGDRHARRADRLSRSAATASGRCSRSGS